MGNTVAIKITADAQQAKAELDELHHKTGTGLGTAARIGGAAIAGLGLAAVGGLAVSINAAANFEQAIDQVGAVSQATERQMGLLADTALRIGRDTAFGATDAAAAMETLAANGIVAADIINGAADAAVNLAAAGGTDLVTAADLVSTSMSVWHMNTSDMTDAVNRLAGAANVSRFGVEDMAQAVAQGGGAAFTAGVEFQDFTTAIAAIAPSFSSGSDAGTSFKTMLNGLTPDTDKQKIAFKKLGLSTEETANAFYDANGNLRSMAEVTGILHDATVGLTEQERLSALQTIFGTDAMRAAAAMSALTADEFTAMSTTMGNSSAADIAAQRMGNFKGSLEGLRGTIETIEIQIGMHFIPVLTALANYASQNIPVAIAAAQAKFEEWRPTIEAIVTTMIELATAVADRVLPIVTALVTYISTHTEMLAAALVGIGSVAGIAFTLWAVTAGAAAVATIAAAAPVIALGLVIAALGAGIFLLIRHWDDLTAKYPPLKAASDAVSDAFHEFATWIRTEFVPDIRVISETVEEVATAVVGFITEHWAQIEPLISFYVGTWKAVFQFFWAEIQTVFEAALLIVKGIYDVFAGLFTGDWERMWGGIKQIFAGIWTFMAETLENALALLVELIRNFGSTLGTVLYQAGRDLVQGFINGIEAMFGAVQSKLGDLTGKLKDWKGPPEVDRLLLFASGQMVIEGFIAGIESRVPNLVRILAGITSVVRASQAAPGGPTGVPPRPPGMSDEAWAAWLLDYFEGLNNADHPYEPGNPRAMNGASGSSQAGASNRDVLLDILQVLQFMARPNAGNSSNSLMARGLA